MGPIVDKEANQKFKGNIFWQLFSNNKVKTHGKTAGPKYFYSLSWKIIWKDLFYWNQFSLEIG